MQAVRTVFGDGSIAAPPDETEAAFAGNYLVVEGDAGPDVVRRALRSEPSRIGPDVLADIVHPNDRI